MRQDETRPRRFQLSIRTLMIGCAVVALLLVPVAWVARERRQMLQMQREILRAREIALASVVREEEARAKRAVARAASASAEELRRQNAELRDQVEALKREIRALKERSVATSPNRP